jgi:carbamoyltransferase
LACLGDSNKFIDEIGKNPWQFSDTWKERIDSYRESTQLTEKELEKLQWDVAASLQLWTEIVVRKVIDEGLKLYPSKNLCLSGGVALNCVCLGKLYDWYDFENIYVTPTPHDGGLTIGAAQYIYHHELDNPRIKWKDNFSPYMGVKYTEAQVRDSLEKFDNIVISSIDDEGAINLLASQKIISVFGGSSESGRRALGNRSILADPRYEDMKNIINEKVKHRQWFRPFAPSILREDVKEWFVHDIDSPYMNFAIEFKEETWDKVKAVLHLDGTGRLQTVTENDNKWYYNFIKMWKEKTGVPILLNTSFNDREPIVETPENAINCFVGTDIDYLYFRDFGILVNRK